MSEEAASTTNVEEQPPIAQKEGVEGDDGGEGGGLGFFSTSRPRDATDGIGKGIGNVAKGVFGGLSLMVAAPIQGAIDGGKEGGGTWGAIKGGGVGLGMGVVGGVATVAYGVGTGAMQIGRGIYNAPGAAMARSEGCDWDEEKKEWFFYNLDEDAKATMEMDEETFISRLRAKEAERKETVRKAAIEAGEEPPTDTTKPSVARNVKDTSLYDVLNVAPSATPGEIKKAYYIEARKSHPDKHLNDPEANARFQKIGEAYQILSDEKSRETYDLGGKDAVQEGAASMDPSALFAIIFGSELFEPIIGELKLASQMRQGIASEQGMVSDESLGSDFNANVLNFIQKQRSVKCALNLVSKLNVFMDSFNNFEHGDEAGFRAAMEAEAAELVHNPVGGVLASTIGYAYLEWVAGETGNAIDSMSVGVKQVSRNAYAKASIGFAGVKSVIGGVQLQKMQTKMAEDKLKGASSHSAGSEEGAKSTAADNKNSSSSGKKEEGSEESAKKTSEGEGGASSSSSSSGAEGEVALTEEEEKIIAEKMMKTLHNVILIMWRVTELDIRGTIADVCKKVTRDHSVEKDVRDKRLRGLQIIGESYIKLTPECSSYGASASDVIAMMTPILSAAQGGPPPGTDEGEEGGQGEKEAA